MDEIKKGLLALIILTFITGLIYPFLMTGINQLLFPKQSNGSLIEINGKIIGSELIAQRFENPKYFMPRSSVTAYDARTSGASNFASSSQDFASEVQKNAESFRKRFELNKNQAVPMDMLTSSASGLDPEVSVESALLQTKIIADIREIKEENIVRLINELSKGGGFTPARVNVLLLNIELDKRFPTSNKE